MKAEKSMPVLTYLSLILTTFLWGGTFVAGRLLANAVPPADAAFLRFSVASIMLGLLVPLVEKRFIIPSRRLLLPLLLLGATGVFAYNVCFFYGLKHISASRAALFIACTPLSITLLAALVFKEPITLMKATGILVSLSGAIIVISNGHLTMLFQGGFGLGELSLMGCVLSWTAYSLIGRSVLTQLPPLNAVFYSSIAGTLLLAFPAFFAGVFSQIPQLNIYNWASITYLGVGGTAIAFSLYYAGIKKIGALRTGVFINLVPVFGVSLAWLILDESVQPDVLAGGALVLLGVAMTNKENVTKPSTAADKRHKP